MLDKKIQEDIDYENSYFLFSYKIGMHQLIFDHVDYLDML